ncbi:MAG TPA: uL15m family ribosomal protein, partial [Candidatus Limnocylindrales bacterium]|nr:uL15m family ribosomal protein [Candidatus Limnocylindrales bacterium]
KLRGFKNRFKIEYAVVNVGQISAYAEAGRFGVELEAPKAARGKKDDAAVVTVNAEVLASAGLINGTAKPIKVLGQGEVNQKLFVAADAFSASAQRKIEEAGGYIQSLAPEKPEPRPKRAERLEAARAAREPGVGSTGEPVASADSIESVESESAESVAEPVTEPAAEPAAEAVAEPVDASVAEPVADAEAATEAVEPEAAADESDTPAPEAEAATEEASAPKRRRSTKSAPDEGA